MQCCGSMCFRLWCVYWVLCSVQLCRMLHFSQAQCKLPEDGPGGPKHVGVNIRYFNVNFDTLYV